MKNWRFLLPLMVVAAITSASCGSRLLDELLGNKDDDQQIDTTRKATEFIGERKYKYSLAQFSSSTAMADYLKAAIKKNTYDYSSMGNYGMGGVADMADGGNDGVSGGTRDTVSSTNLQEVGVDESDIVKTDGSTLYVAVKSRYSPYAPATGVKDGTTDPSGGGGVPSDGGGGADGSSSGVDAGSGVAADSGNYVRVMEISDAPPSASEIATIVPSSSNVSINELYLVTGRGDGLPDLLATVTTGNGMADSWYYFWYWQDGKTGLMITDVTDPAKPSTVTELEFDGYLVATRRIGDKVYIVSRYTPSIEGYNTYTSTSAEVDRNETLLQDAALEDLLPALYVDGVATGSLVNSDNCYLPPTSNDAINTPDVISITAIDLASPSSPETGCIVGAGETVYVSTEALYLATTVYDYSTVSVMVDVATGIADSAGTGSGGVATDGSGSTGGGMSVGSNDVATSIGESGTTSSTVAVDMVVYSEPVVTTDIHKFGLAGSVPEYKGSATVDGHLGWEQDKKSFRLGEQDGYLRVASSLGDSWNLTASTQLTVLRESDNPQDLQLVEVSRLPNDARPDAIGKPGEMLYAARFIGNRVPLKIG